MNHYPHPAQFADRPSYTTPADGPTVRVEINASLRMGSHIVHEDFTAWVTVYRNPFGDGFEVEKMEVETWDKDKLSSRVVMMGTRGFEYSLDHFYADAIADAAYLRVNADRIEEELSKVEREWEA